MIKLNHVNKYYNKNKSNEIHVINDTSLELESKGLVTFLGPSGAGKSTLLHVIGGLDKAKGDIIYDDLNINHTKSGVLDSYRNKHIGYVFQNYNLLPNLSVYDNLRIQLELIQIYDKDVIDRKINECLKIVGMERYKRRNITALSGGQQQRVSIARALVKNAEVIIADEPTGNLDSKNSVDIMNILKILSKKCLIILITHETNLANHYSDRIIRIHDGTVIEDTKNSNANSLLHTDSNALYLNQYQKKSYGDQENQIEFYSNNESKVEFKIVVAEDGIYIKNTSDLPVKIVGETTDRYMIDSAPKEEPIPEDVTLNLEELTPESRTFKTWLGLIWKDIKDSFHRLFGSNKKTKFLYISFVFIGMILCLCLNSLSISTILNEDVLKETPKNTIRVDFANADKNSKYGYSIDREKNLDILKNTKSITGIVDTVKNPFITYTTVAQRKISISISEKTFITTPNVYDCDEIVLKNNELIISDKVADLMLAYTSPLGLTTYQQLKENTYTINLPEYYTGEMRIKDIISTGNYTFLVSDYMYFSKSDFVSNSQLLHYGYYENSGQFYEAYQKSLPTPIYLTPFSDKQVFISKNLFDLFKYYDRTNDLWRTSTSLFDVVRLIDEEGFNIMFRNKEQYLKFISDDCYVYDKKNILPYRSQDIQMTEGAMPMNDQEVILPDTLITREISPINSIYKYDNTTSLKVVGYFKVDYPFNLNVMYSNFRTAYLIKTDEIISDILKSNHKTIDYYSMDINQSIKDFNEIGYPTYDLVKKVLSDNTATKIDTSRIAIIISISVVAVMILFIFFINRSKMVHNIYEIGVLRALGAKKMKIYKQYFIDSIILTTCTVFLGFTLIYLFSINVNNFISGFAIAVPYYLISVVAIYVIMILAALTPVLLLLRKTPIEIINKYDI